MYGQTEATARISCLPSSRLDDKPGSVGLPLDNLDIRIVDAAGLDVPTGRTGELWVAGRSVCAGYFGDPEETALKFRDGWLLTGDVARRDEDGYLWITGRKSEFIKMRGVRVSFAEIEERIATVPGVAECAALAVPHVEAGEALALFVVPTAGAGDIAAVVRRAVPPEWVCESVTLLAELPRNANGKLMRARLPEAPRLGLGDREPARAPESTEG
jgi:acyl-CoA synthetase (AMP-forming)/AMP-acid ligase II